MGIPTRSHSHGQLCFQIYFCGGDLAGFSPFVHYSPHCCRPKSFDPSGQSFAASGQHFAAGQRGRLCPIRNGGAAGPAERPAREIRGVAQQHYSAQIPGRAQAEPKQARIYIIFTQSSCQLPGDKSSVCMQSFLRDLDHGLLISKKHSFKGARIHTFVMKEREF